MIILCLQFRYHPLLQLLPSRADRLCPADSWCEKRKMKRERLMIIHHPQNVFHHHLLVLSFVSSRLMNSGKDTGVHDWVLNSMQ